MSPTESYNQPWLEAACSVNNNKNWIRNKYIFIYQSKQEVDNHKVWNPPVDADMLKICLPEKKKSADDSKVENCEEDLLTLMWKTFLSLRRALSHTWKCAQVRDAWKKMSKLVLTSHRFDFIRIPTDWLVFKCYFPYYLPWKIRILLFFFFSQK